MRKAKFPRDKGKKIKLFITDVDGVLTDGRIVIGKNGEEFKNFHVMDGTGIRIALKAGIKVAIISGRKSAATQIRAKELGISEVWQVQGNKEKVYEKLRKKYDLAHSEIAYAGDDLYDIGIMKKAGLSIAVPGAADEVKRIAHYVTKRAGGFGAVRELIDLIIKSQKKKPISMISICLLVSCLWMSACSKEAELPQTQPPENDDTEETGERIEGGFSYTATEHGKVILEVKGESAKGLSSDSVHIEKPKVKWYSRNGEVAVEADKGILIKETGDINFEGTVSVSSDRGEIHSDRADWIASEKRIKASGNAKGKFYIHTDDSEN